MTRLYPCADALNALSSHHLVFADRFGERDGRFVLFAYDTI